MPSDKTDKIHHQEKPSNIIGNQGKIGAKKARGKL